MSRCNSICFSDSLWRFFELAQQRSIAARIRSAQRRDTALGKSAHGSQ
jgi:hypothetical protein